MTDAEYKSDDLRENWPHYNSIAGYIVTGGATKCKYGPRHTVSGHGNIFNFIRWLPNKYIPQSIPKYKIFRNCIKYCCKKFIDVWIKQVQACDYEWLNTYGQYGDQTQKHCLASWDKVVYLFSKLYIACTESSEGQSANGFWNPAGTHHSKWWGTLNHIDNFYPKYTPWKISLPQFETQKYVISFTSLVCIPSLIL